MHPLPSEALHATRKKDGRLSARVVSRTIVTTASILVAFGVSVTVG